MARKRSLDQPELKSVILVVLLNKKKNAELIFIPGNISLLQVTPFYSAFISFIHSFKKKNAVLFKRRCQFKINS